MRERRHHSGERGFTLMETLVTLILVAVVTLGVFRIFTSTNQAYRRGTESIDGQQNARAALTWLQKELRGAKGFTFIDDDEVTFLSDKNVPNQIRTFRLDENDEDNDGDTNELLLIRNPADDGTPGVVIDEIAVGIESLAFTYRNSAGATTTSRAAVQEVEVVIITTGNQMREAEEADAHGVRQIEMSTRVRCRNLGKSVPTLGDVTPPVSPTGLNVTVGCGTGTVSWTANTETDLAGYYLSYAADAGGSPYGGNGADQGPSPIFVGNVTTYTLTGLDTSRDYFFNLQAVDQADNVSFFGSEVRGMPTDASAPTTPTNLTGFVVGNDQIRVTWDPSNDWDVAWYKISWKADSDPSSVRIDSTVASTFVVTGLDQEEVYHFKVSAGDNCGNESPYSNPITITMTPCDQDVDFPEIPGSFRVVAGDEFVQLDWTPTPDHDVIGYQVYFVESGYAEGYTLLVGNVSRYSVYGLENGTDYSFQVAALDGCGHVGGYTGLLEATPFQCADNSTPPMAPANLDARDLGVGDQIRLSWTQASEGDVLGYIVFWGTSDGAWTGVQDVGEDIFHTLYGLLPGTTYYFTVVAYDVCGNMSPHAGTESATTTWGCACPPIALTLSPPEYAILQGTVEWTAKALPCSADGIAFVEFEIDGHTRYVDYSAPWEYGDFGGGWTTTLEENGAHTLVINVQDTDGCLSSDTTSVYVDNSGLGVSCIGVPEGENAILTGVYDNELVVPIQNLSAVDTYDVDRIVLGYDLPGVYPMHIYLDDMLAWYAPSWPSGGAGDTLALTGTMSFPPTYEFEMRILFWDNPPSSVPDLGLAGGSYEVLFLGGPIVECGPYAFSVASDCLPPVEIASVNSAKPYDVWGVPSLADEYYTDRSYRLTYLPGEIEESILVRTPNDDKNLGGSHKLKLRFDEDVTVYIAYDPRGTPPNWIKNNYENTGLTIGVTDAGTSTLGLWKRDLDAGTRTFYGNKAKGWSGAVGTNYIIFVVCRESQ